MSATPTLCGKSACGGLTEASYQDIELSEVPHQGMTLTRVSHQGMSIGYGIHLKLKKQASGMFSETTEAEVFAAEFGSTNGAISMKLLEKLQDIDPSLFKRAMRDASGRMKSVERMCVKIELLRDFNVFHSQCKHLVQIISKGIQECGGKKWKRAAIVLSVPPPEFGKYTGSRFLLQIRDFNWSLDIVRHSLELSDTPQSSTATEQTINTTYTSTSASRSKGSKLGVTFDRSNEISRQVDLSRVQSGNVWTFKWSHCRCRYRLQRNVHASEREVESREDDDQQASEREDEIRVATEARSCEYDVNHQASDCEGETGVVDDREESLQGDFDRQARDRENLLGILQKHMTARAHGSSFFPSVRRLSCNTLLEDETPTNKYLAVVESRCQDSSGSDSENLVSKCFEINHLDLKMREQVSKGVAKRVSRANWLGQEVAVAVVKHTPRDFVEKEAGFLVKLHHPNVVDFFGFALREEALTKEAMASAEKIEPTWTGYLVMELMQEDLRSLINKLLRGPRKPEYRGPFSLSITVDILLQIVEAMIHTHKFDILHRDLKPRNCLVNPKPVSSPKAEGVSSQYYIVKLIDFGEPKFWTKDGKQTLKMGTVRWMAPEVWKSSEYSKSADVYSFGMTCYDVVTGLTPFQGIPEKAVTVKVLEGMRPTIPGTCPQSLSDLMKKCWAHVPMDRPTFEEIQKYLWAIKYSVDIPIIF